MCGKPSYSCLKKSKKSVDFVWDPLYKFCDGLLQLDCPLTHSRYRFMWKFLLLSMDFSMVATLVVSCNLYVMRNLSVLTTIMLESANFCYSILVTLAFFSDYLLTFEIWKELCISLHKLPQFVQDYAKVKISKVRQKFEKNAKVTSIE